MKNTSLTFLNNGKIQIDYPEITFRNFAGRETDFNEEGNRNFVLVIRDEEIANALADAGANINYKEPYREGDTGEWRLKVKVSYRFGGPIAHLVSNGRIKSLTEENIHILDGIDIQEVRGVDIRLSKWSRSGRSGYTAYLDKICVVQEVDRFLAEYASEEYPEE